jgi:hypothetical protein
MSACAKIRRHFVDVYPAARPLDRDAEDITMRAGKAAAWV